MWCAVAAIDHHVLSFPEQRHHESVTRAEQMEGGPERTTISRPATRRLRGTTRKVCRVTSRSSQCSNAVHPVSWSFR